MAGRESLEERLSYMEQLLEEMRAEVANGRTVLKDIRSERKEIDRLLKDEVRVMVHERVDETLKREIDRITPEMKKHTEKLYDHVAKEVDKLVDLALGKEFSLKRGHEDLRPELAKHLKVWIASIISER